MLLKSCTPSLVKLGSPNDYFCNEQVDVWGIDSFWGLPHHPKVEYYRSLTKQISEHEYFYEFIVPMVPNNWLDEDTVKQYEDRIHSHIRPTALCLSILDVRQPWDSQTAHWCLTHYVLDGHHKIFAASKIAGEVTLLSFLNIGTRLQLEKMSNESFKYFKMNRSIMTINVVVSQTGLMSKKDLLYPVDNYSGRDILDFTASG